MLSVTIVRLAELCGWNNRLDGELVSNYLRSDGDPIAFLRVRRALREDNLLSRSTPKGSNPPALVSLLPNRISAWSRSTTKRVFDCACVILVLPLLIPLFVAIGLAVRVTTRGPIFFLQRRMGRNGRTFTIMKFRTLEHNRNGKALRFTPIGPFLRRWRLDELPQLWNVLKGDMSLVGPRPRLPEFQTSELLSRPGITGAATLAFAREEILLARVPIDELDDLYRRSILPLKQIIDADYTARATFASDLKLLIDTSLCRWDTSVLESLLRELKTTERSESVDFQANESSDLEGGDSVDQVISVINYVRTVEPDCLTTN